MAHRCTRRIRLRANRRARSLKTLALRGLVAIRHRGAFRVPSRVTYVTNGERRRPGICYGQLVHNQGGSMSLSRRSFFRTAGAAGVGLLSSDFISARGREAFAAIQSSAVAGYRPQGAAQVRRAIIKISSNENAYGPGPAAL